MFTTEDVRALEVFFALINLLLAVGNVGFHFGSRRRLEAALTAHEALQEKQFEKFEKDCRERAHGIRNDMSREFAGVRKDASECTKDRRDLATLIAKGRS
jgi:hypothetical protein